MRRYHLAVLKKRYLEAILAGRKRVESRFTRTRRQPFGRVRLGDRLFLKASGGPVCGTAVVARVEQFEDLTPERMFQIKKRYNSEIQAGQQYWREKAACRFGILLWLEDVRRIEPVRISKRDWRAWVVLSEGEDFGLPAGGKG